jgi:hypothetical protein
MSHEEVNTLRTNYFKMLDEEMQAASSYIPVVSINDVLIVTRAYQHIEIYIRLIISKENGLV